MSFSKHNLPIILSSANALNFHEIKIFSFGKTLTSHQTTISRKDKLKGFADDKLHITQILIFVFEMKDCRNMRKYQIPPHNIFKIPFPKGL